MWSYYEMKNKKWKKLWEKRRNIKIKKKSLKKMMRKKKWEQNKDDSPLIYCNNDNSFVWMGEIVLVENVVYHNTSAASA